MFPDCCGTLGNPEIGRVTENARAVTGTIVNSPARYFIFPIPMPCLPVQVSDIRSARRIVRSAKRLAASSYAGSFGSITQRIWKFPSPT
jgi:hypothetical protein